VVKNPLLCLFHHILTTVRLHFKNSEIKTNNIQNKLLAVIIWWNTLYIVQYK